jgi:hypothetical protein
VRFAAAVSAAGLLLVSGCGYVGPVLPPSPELPQPVASLNAIEKGDQIVITFETPVQTTDNLPIRHLEHIDVGVGVAPAPFDVAQWSAQATHYELPAPAPTPKDETPAPAVITKTLPAQQWIGKHLAVLVRTSVKREDHESQWSNRVVLNVVPPLKQPIIKVTAVKDGYMITWSEEQPGLKYQIFRQGPLEKSAALIGTADASPYLDKTSQWDTRYTYSAVAQQDTAESLPSEPVEVMHANSFPPSIPASLAALAGPESVELSWSRSPETYLKGYYVYRSVNGGPFTRIGDLQALPTYSDHQVEHGKTYAYAVTAVSQAGYESEKSPPAAVTF